MLSAVTHKQIRAFVAVAHARSIVDACGIVNLSQPALSISIKNLEAALGGELFSRSSRRVMTLSQEGRVFLPIAERLLDDWDNAILSMQDQFSLKHGRLSMASMSSFSSNLLPAVLKRFVEEYPNVELNVQDAVGEVVIDLVRAGQVEMGVTFDPEGEDGVEFEPLFEEVFHLAVPPDHPLADAENVTWKQALEHPVIMLDKHSRTRGKIEAAMRDTGLEPPRMIETRHFASVGSFVAGGLGVSVVPDLACLLMEQQGARIVPFTNEAAIRRKMGLVTRPNFPLSRASSAMRDLIADELAV